MDKTPIIIIDFLPEFFDNLTSIIPGISSKTFQNYMIDRNLPDKYEYRHIKLRKFDNTHNCAVQIFYQIKGFPHKVFC